MAEAVDPKDEPVEIHESDILMRWVHKWNTDRRSDGTVKKLKPGAFPLQPSDQRGFSLFLERLMSFERCMAKAKGENPENIGIVRMELKDFQDFDLSVIQQVEDGEIAHCEVIGYSSKTEDDLTNIKRQWINRSKDKFTAF